MNVTVKQKKMFVLTAFNMWKKIFSLTFETVSSEVSIVKTNISVLFTFSYFLQFFFFKKTFLVYLASRINKFEKQRKC